MISALWTAPKAMMRWVKVGGCIAKPPREMRSDSGEPMGQGFGGARERAAATAAEYAGFHQECQQPYSQLHLGWKILTWFLTTKGSNMGTWMRPQQLRGHHASAS